MSCLIKIIDLEFFRDKRMILKIDRFEIEKERVLAVIGPNGAGKSSLLHILTRLLKIQKGNILWGDTPISNIPALEYRRRLALVMQEPLLLDRSVEENIAVGLKFRGEDAKTVNQKINKWADKFHISHLLKRPAKQISGGEAQRVSLARAFALEPELLLLDEPFSALDPQTRKELVKDLREVLNQTKTTTIFVTHDLSDVSALSDNVVLIWDGTILQYGMVEDVFARPINDAAKRYFGKDK